MQRSLTPLPDVSWSISVPADFDETVRLFLASQGEKEESLSSLAQKAVARYILSSVAAEAKAKVRKSGISQEELNRIIDEGVSFARGASGAANC